MIVVVFGATIYILALFGTPFLAGLDLHQSLLIAFALSFSSTVFVVKALEEKGEMASLHGRIAIGILIVQDIAAVVFLAISTGKWPSLWALAIALLIPLRLVLHQLLQRAGHSELLVLFGFLLALGGAEIFEMVGLKGDLGALVLGLMIANHVKADEMAKTMLGFKDLFLLGFFLSIGLSGPVTLETVIAGAIITPFVFLKPALFCGLLTGFKLRARTSLFASLNLTNFSEFGLIVAAVGVANGWINAHWLIVIAIALSLSCAIAAGLNVFAHQIHARYRTTWRRVQRSERLADDRLLDIGRATIAVIGMGRIGTRAYDEMRQMHGGTVVGIDIDPLTVEHQQTTGRNVLLGDPSDADFWDRVHATHSLELVMLALPRLTANLAVLDQLKASSYSGRVAATTRYADDVERLKNAGASTVFNVYAEAGSGFAAHVAEQIQPATIKRAGAPFHPGRAALAQRAQKFGLRVARKTCLRLEDEHSWRVRTKLVLGRQFMGVPVTYDHRLFYGIA